MDTMTSATGMPRLLDTPEAAEVLNVGTVWLKKAVTAGLVQHTRVGRRVKFSQADLDAFIAARTVPAVNKAG